METKLKSKYTNDQQIALDTLVPWLQRPFNNDEITAVLAGAAGTGKTFINSEILIQSGRIKSSNIVVTAPTHKAKEVIGNKTGLTAQTIQSLLGLRPNTDLVNFNIARPQFDPMSEPKIGDYSLVIIDECSMLNSDLYDLLIDNAERYKVKLLFVGDKFQLPPVENDFKFKNKVSKCFTEPKIKVELKEVVRQSNTNPITELLDALRKDIEFGTNTFWNIIKKVPRNIRGYQGYQVLNRGDFSNLAVNMYKSSEFKLNSNYIKYTAWTNNAIEKWNDFIRKKLYDDVLYPNKGELMMAYKTTQSDKNIIGGALLINSSEYIVDKVKKDISSNQYPNEIKGIELDLTEISSGEKTTIFLVDNQNQDNLNNFLSIYREKNEIAKNTWGTTRKPKWDNFFSFVNYHNLLRDLKRGKTKLAFKTIDYGYACTVHKTQGSTYNHIFVNGQDIECNPDALERKKLWYVALSRCSESAIIYL